MKILYITNGISGSGGLERVLSIKSSGLIEIKNYEIHILSLFENPQATFYNFNPRVKIHFGKLKSISSFKGFLNYIRKINIIIQNTSPDVILVCDDGLKAFFLPLLIKTNGIPMIYERHVSKKIELQYKSSWMKKQLIYFKWTMMDLLANQFSSFIVLTEKNKKEWQSVKNLKVIPNPNSFYPDTKSSLKNEKIICVGKVSFQKGQDILARLWSKINIEFPNWELHNYGKLNSKFLSEENLPQNMYIHPPVKDIENKYLDSSIYVMTSRFEGFGMVLIEAMSYGIPCIAFDCNYGPSDIIKNDEDGIIIDMNDEDLFIKKLSELINNFEYRKNLGTKASINVKRFNLENIIEEWDDLFKEAVKK